VDRPDYDPGAALVDAGENTVMTRTFSKIFGLGGARLGWAYAPPAITDVLNRVRPPFPVNNFAAVAGVAALREPGWLERGRAHNSQAKRRLSECLTQTGLTVYPSEANFILVDFGSEDQAVAADEHLRRCGIIVRRVKSYGLPQCLRITIGTDAACARVAAALAEFRHG
jgi:histidinol-phosphate aminotransferase